MSTMNGSHSEFAGKVVLITGAGRGIGRAVAEAFGACGAIIAANDITPINLDVTLDRLQKAGVKSSGYVFDISKKIPVETLVMEVLEEWERIDILINNAGVEPRGSILEMDDWDWQRTLDVNLGGPFYTLQQVGRVMRQQGGGVVVNVAASAGRSHGFKDRAAYIASKMGLLGLTREAAREFSSFNIRVNAVCPGLVLTGRPDEPQQPLLPEGLAPNRMGQPEEVADLILFLCSRQAAHINGQAINIDGGQEMD
jgi:NAD(P)-dependent dehydrogenase (short-subunit alcohol dehydrogenase family)